MVQIDNECILFGQVHISQHIVFDEEWLVPISTSHIWYRYSERSVKLKVQAQKGFYIGLGDLFLFAEVPAVWSPLGLVTTELYSLKSWNSFHISNTSKCKTANQLSDFIFFGFSVNQLMVYQLYQVLVYFAPQGLVPKGHTSVSSSCKISLFWADTSYFFKQICCA